jgi:PhzF family phenazine biosynthesis protein
MKISKKITRLGIFRVNAFVAGPYQGNPAGVFLLPRERTVDFYRKAAVLMDCPETAFLHEENGDLQLRWFTRGGSEVDLCGHATLATACILWRKGYAGPRERLCFQTKSGALTAMRDGTYVTLGFPREDVTEAAHDKYDFEKLVGLRPVYVGRTRFDYFLAADSEKAVINLAPDFEKLKEVRTRGIIITAKSTKPEYDFVSRFFAPAIGIDEDPVTGSAHCALGPYWGSILKKNDLIGYQASREGGIVRVKLLPGGVLLSGQAQEIPVSIGLKEAIRNITTG